MRVLCVVLLLSLVPSVLGAGFTGYTEQWAVSATASSTDYSSGYDPMFATGHVNGDCGSDNNVWLPSNMDASTLRLVYSNGVYPAEIYVRQTIDGNIAKLEAEDSSGNIYVLWSGTNETCDFYATVNSTKKITAIILTTTQNSQPHIDAVRLGGYTDYTVDFFDRAATAKTTKGSSVSFSVGIADPRNITSARALVTPAAGQAFSVSLNLTAGTKGSGSWSGSWAVPQSAAEGSYSVVFEGCNDFVCKTSSGVTFEVIGGYIIEASADRQEYKRGETVTVTGKVKDTSGTGAAGDVSVSLLNTTLSAQADGFGAFRVERLVPASTAGETTIKVSAQGATKEIKINVNPTLIVSASAPATTPKGEFFAVSGNVTGAVGSVTTVLFVYGKAKATGGKNFSFNVLAEADLTIEIKATDEFGNEGTVSKKVSVSAIADEKRINLDVPETAYWGDEITIKASGSENITFDVNGEKIIAAGGNGIHEITYAVRKTPKLLVRASSKGLSASKEITVKEPEIRIQRIEDGVKATLNGFPKDNLDVYAIDGSGKKVAFVNVGGGVYKGAVNGNVRIYASGDGKRGYEELSIAGKQDYGAVLFAFASGALALSLVKVIVSRGRGGRELEEIEKRMKNLQDRYFKGEIDKDSYESVMLELEIKKNEMAKRVKR